VGESYIAVEPTGTFSSVREFEDLLISGVSEAGKGQIYLRDVANVRRGYVEPPARVLRYDGHPAIGLGISTTSGGNVVTMGAAVEKRARELAALTPLGIEFGIVSLQSDAVTTAIDGFLVSLAEAVAIVIVVLLAFMGVRSGLIIGFVLGLTICGTFIFMGPWDVALERISLGALIIALGMLVDNAIVVVDGVLVRTKRGEDAAEAAKAVVAQTSMPLLGATAVAIMAFGAIGLSEDSTGEFCRSLFRVVFISLGLSWITAVTVTPLLCVMFLKPEKPKPGSEGGDQEAYGGAMYTAYRTFLGVAIRFRYVSTAVVLVLFAVSLWGFQYVDKTFFPNSTRPQFMIDFWLPQGTYIGDTMETSTAVEKYLLELDGATHVTTLGGAGGLRFLLTYSPEKVNSAYLQYLVDVEDYTTIEDLIAQVEQELPELFPDSEVYGRKFILGPGSGGKIQIRFSGPDPEKLRTLASQTMTILHEDGGAKAIRTDWRDQVKVIRPIVAEEEANYAGVSQPDIAMTIAMGFEGVSVGVYREGDELLPIIIRAPAPERIQVESIQNLQIWSPAAQQNIPLRQVVAEFETDFEDEIVQRLNRKSTITVHTDPISGASSRLRARILPKVEALEKGPDYEIEWWGEYRDSNRAAAGIAASLPFFLLSMVLIVIGLFNALRQPLVIWLCVPLAIIGVTAGLLLTRQPFGFMALLGFMSLSGMLIKNAIVLIDEIELQKTQSSDIYKAIVESGVSRLRPVAMAALTTALGMIPLVLDAFFIAMAVTVIFGLMVATVLTMVMVPVFYAMFFRVPSPGPAKA
jgi:multidrug efflux pump subunit AcrB